MPVQQETDRRWERYFVPEELFAEREGINTVESKVVEAIKMNRDRMIGGLLFAGGIIGIIVYGVLVWLWPIIVLQLTAILGAVVLFGVLAWIGWTMATTPPIEPTLPEVTSSPQTTQATPDEKK